MGILVTLHNFPEHLQAAGRAGGAGVTPWSCSHAPTGGLDPSASVFGFFAHRCCLLYFPTLGEWSKIWENLIAFREITSLAFLPTPPFHYVYLPETPFPSASPSFFFLSSYGRIPLDQSPHTKFTRHPLFETLLLAPFIFWNVPF